jgi:5'-deoxynucleotidase YfbR-like HD superfamily hydrolase
MTKPSHSSIIALIRTIVLPFYHIKRDIQLPIGDRRWENDAEHSWSTAFLACALAPQVDPKLDIGLIAQYAIAHDIVEVYANDTSALAGQGELASKKEREANALARIARELKQFPWVAQTVQEYEHHATDEAKFVYALDKYIPVVFDYLDKGQLFRERGITLTSYNKLLGNHRKKAQTHAEIGKYYDELRQLLNQHPEFFYPEGS